MNRPPLEVADLIRVAGQRFIDRSRSWLTAQHRKVLAAIERCRTAALGGHRDECSRCGYRAISYNSCRNRHCPKCQAQARDRWLRRAEQELLPTRYVHVVFTLPHLLAPLALQNKKVLYDLLFRASAQTLLEVARHPRHLGAEIGFFSVLHTWNQKLEHHPHVHCVVPAGGLSPDHQRWLNSRRRFFLPIPVLARVFRGKFVAALKQAFAEGQLGFHGQLKPLASPQSFLFFPAPTLPSGLGRLLQTALRGARICPSLSGRLHPSRRHLQPSPRFPDGRPSHLPLARLRPRQPAAPHDPVRGRVLATLSPPRTSPRLRAHPPLRFPRPSPSCATSTPLFPVPAIGDQFDPRLNHPRQGTGRFPPPPRFLLLLGPAPNAAGP